MGTNWLGKGCPRAKTAARCSDTVRKISPGATGPVFRAVGVFLMFPNRHGGLDSVYEFFQYRKRFGAGRGGKCLKNCHLPDIDITSDEYHCLYVDIRPTSRL